MAYGNASISWQKLIILLSDEATAHEQPPRMIQLVVKPTTDLTITTPSSNTKIIRFFLTACVKLLSPTDTDSKTKSHYLQLPQSSMHLQQMPNVSKLHYSVRLAT